MSDHDSLPSELIPDELITNLSTRCPCAILVDSSYSMSGDPIARVNEGLKELLSDLQTDSKASQSVELSVISFGGEPKVLMDWCEVAHATSMPEVSAEGHTPLGEAMDLALDLIDERLSVYAAAGVTHFVPWIFIITDGAPNQTARWPGAVKRIQQAQVPAPGRKSPDVIVFAVSTDHGEHAMGLLKSVTPRTFELQGMQFGELFTWLSKSLKSASQKAPGEKTRLDAPDPGMMSLSDIDPLEV